MRKFVIIKAVGKKSDVFDIQVYISCFPSGEGKSRLPKTFDSFETLIRHIEQCHHSHPHYKTLRTALKKFQILTKYYTPKVKHV